MSVLTDEQVREAFERWYVDEMRTTKPAFEPEVIRADDLVRVGDRYKNVLITLMWRQWQAAARLGAEIEREACAKVCEEMQDGLNDHYDAGCYQCASAIRARAGKEGG